MSDYRPIIWRNEKLFLLDQRLLPTEEVFVEINDINECILAIKNMIVRGAPCIGFSAIYGLSLWIKNNSKFNQNDFRNICDLMINARPTAVNLAYEVNRCFEIVSSLLLQDVPSHKIFEKIVNFGHEQILTSQSINTKMAELGFSELSKKFGQRPWKLMTHCNTGFLACGSIGTALGVISYAHSKGMVEHVYADETRPYLQGSRLTAFELKKEGIPYSLVVEGAASYLLSHGKVDAIFVGADRIAINGDTANKVGTSTLAIAAKHYQVPFYVVAPLSSFDTTIQSGNEIEIEMRPMAEITHIKNIQMAPEGAQAINPSFDVTDHRFITGIICEKGFINPEVSGDLLRVVNS
jgi:methylthioribose-1-phosphate isomerase